MRQDAKTWNYPDVDKMERAYIRGGELEYVTRGDGEPVLFIHGAHIANAFLPLFEQPALTNYKLILYHRRGYADSSAAEGPPETYFRRKAANAAALLKHLSLERAHIVGHSSGGLVALQMALDTPEIVKSLILLEPALLAVPSGPAHGQMLEPVMERYLKGDPVGAVDGFMQIAAGPDWRTEISRTVPGGPEQADEDAATFFEFELPAVGMFQSDNEQWSRFSQPVLYVGGENTLEMFIEGRELVRSWFPQTEYHIVPDANHSLEMQNPRSVAEGIAAFLRRHVS